MNETSMKEIYINEITELLGQLDSERDLWIIRHFVQRMVETQQKTEPG